MASLSESVILIDESDREIGSAEKLDVHRKGLLHRAFSVVVWDASGRQLLQKRAQAKYHSGGLWTNTCCGHPRPGEPVAAAAARRLNEEMGFTCPLEWLGIVEYRADVGNDLVEHEIVHIFRARYDGAILPDPSEVEGYRWCGIERIRRDVAASPHQFTAWFRRYLAEDWPVALRPRDPSAAAPSKTQQRMPR